MCVASVGFLSSCLRPLSECRRESHTALVHKAQKKKKLLNSVAYPGCLSRIRIFPFRIQGQKDCGSRIRIHIKETSRIRILIFLPIPDPGSRVQKWHWIPDPDPQHCY
jgi:hypothetical protein